METFVKKSSPRFQILQTIEVHFEADILRRFNYTTCNVLPRLLEVKLPLGDWFSYRMSHLVSSLNYLESRKVFSTRYVWLYQAKFELIMHECSDSKLLCMYLLVPSLLFLV